MREGGRKVRVNVTYFPGTHRPRRQRHHVAHTQRHGGRSLTRYVVRMRGEGPELVQWEATPELGARIDPWTKIRAHAECCLGSGAPSLQDVHCPSLLRLCLQLFLFDGLEFNIVLQ